MATTGDRKHNFAIERATKERVGQDRKPVYSVIGHRQGSLTPGSATEPVVTEQAIPQTAYKSEILFFPGLTSKDRLTLGSRKFRIVGPPVDPDGKRMKHVLNLVEREFDTED